MKRDTIRRVRPRGLKKQIEKDLFSLRKAYAKALRAHDDTAMGEWLCDNFYLLEREGRGVVSQLKTAPPLPLDEDGTVRIYALCLHAVRNSVKLSEETLENSLREAGLCGAEVELLPLFLRVALLHTARLSCEETGEAAVHMLSFAVLKLRALQDWDFDALLEALSPVEQILAQDPAGVYPEMDEATRFRYRRLIAQAARRDGITEQEAALEALHQAQKGETPQERHVGAWLPAGPSYQRRGRNALFMEAFFPLVVTVCIAVLAHAWYLIPLLYLPVWEILHFPIEAAFSRGVAVQPMLRMNLEAGIPEEGATLITVSTLLPGAPQARKMGRHLEQLWRTNGRGSVKICVLADLKGAHSPVMPQDASDIAASKREIEQLNRRHGGGFVLIVRERTYSRTQGEYTGEERKRGAIEALVRYLCGEDVSFRTLCGDTDNLRRMKYILALDADTVLPLDAASQLVAAALHPLNRPVIDEKRGVVTRGYGILVPRVETELTSAGATGFSRVMADAGGLVAYDTAASERYQDFFGRSIFSGKGLIDISAFYQVLPGAFEPECVLSHDILEGGFLRAGFVSDVQVADGFPGREGAFLDRMHRWVRGDWQNLPFLFRGNKGKDGQRKNPLGALTRWQLFDNLRRSFTPVMAFVCLLAALFAPSPVRLLLILGGVLCTAAGNLYGVLRAVIAGGPGMFSRLYYSRVTPVAMGNLLRALVNVVMLAQTAFVCLDALIRALWRRFVSHKRKLEWVTAAQSDVAQRPAALLKRYLPSLLAGAFLMLFGRGSLWLCGFLFLCNVPFAIFSARQGREKTKELSWEQRERLTSYAAAAWRYYEEFCGVQDNYLPPDNVQETPVHRVAHRTSPTNIGLALLCTLAARDFSLIDSAMLCERIDKMLASVERMEKWNGNLYNWYDTASLRILEPRYVSTVDSGNFFCCLTALQQGLLEYAAEYPALADQANRVGKLLDAGDLSPLYNPRRKLFHIGFDAQTGKLTGSYYDLLMSEARMMSFYAVGRRQAPKKHWGALGRMLAREGRYTGPVSWTGTMFEYYMPHLLLPLYDGTLGKEAMRFCSYCQKRRVRGKDIPWGISESGFYAFDPQLNYQYKAHGVQKLGLKRGLNDELVISPYSTFLLLPFEPEAALKNLDELEKMQMTGRCGFYEAADFSPERVDGQEYAVVRSYMAHHVGMSMVSICNALKGFAMQNRFMRDDRMAAARCLLEEKIPTGASVFRDVELRETPQRAQRVTPATREIAAPNPVCPQMHLLTNGEWSTVVSDCGTSVSLYRESDITWRGADLLRRPKGIFAIARAQDETLPLCRALDYRSKAEFSAQFSHTQVKLAACSQTLSGETVIQVHPRLPCEHRRYTLKNLSRDRQRVSLLIYLEPCLAPAREAKAHPAFSKLFLEQTYDAGNKIQLFSRRPRGDGEPMCLAAGFLEDVGFHYEGAREKLLNNPDGIFTLRNAPINLGDGKGVGDPVCAFSVMLEMEPHAQRYVTLLLTAASTRAEAVDRLLRSRQEGKIAAGAPNPFYENSLDGILAAQVLPQLFYPPRETNEYLAAAQENDAGVQALWSLGISGDHPILYIQIQNAEDTARALPLIRLNRKLRRSGIPTDVAIGYREGGDYDKPVLGALKSALQREKCVESFNTPGGIHAVDLQTHSAQSILALQTAARYIAPPAAERMELPVLPFVPFAVFPVLPAQRRLEMDFCVKRGGFAENGAFVVTEKPDVPWCHVLANLDFGTLVESGALGYTWAVNARENKLTPWFNDTRTGNRGELLFLRMKHEVYDLVQGARAEFSPSMALWRGRAGKVETAVTVTVPDTGMVKYCEAELYNNGKEAVEVELVYYTEPVLGVDRQNARFIKSRWQDGVLSLHSPWNTAVPGYMALTGGVGEDAFCCCDRADFWRGKWGEKRMLPLDDPCAAVGRRLILPPKRKEKVRFVLSFAAKEPASKALLSISPKQVMRNSLEINTPDKALNHMISTFLPAQILNSRIFGRTAFYQCGGAWGFRDQLQDVCSIILLRPRLARQHILRAAACQFPEGDVLHWWHRLPGRNGLRGVRTRYSDDLLWLPYVTAEYVKQTGDSSLLHLKIPYLEGELLRDDEHERYFEPRVSKERGTLYEHCLRAITRAQRFGAHELPLIGGGDWNDGFNRVGIQGRGESVWLAQFMALTLDEMRPVCLLMQDVESERQLAQLAENLRGAVDRNAWDGRWYRRAFYDDGAPMGSSGAAACEIDSLPQSFSILSGMPDKERRNLALDSAVERLVDREHGLIRLFTPPFTELDRAPGYVAAYPAGIRENGGQYTHAAVWLCMALLREGRVDEGYSLLKLLNPAEKCAQDTEAKRYVREPYALAGDVSTAQGLEGRGGWSLYTGAAGWYYRTVVEELLGLRLRSGTIEFEPHLPSCWHGYSATLTLDGAVIAITVSDTASPGLMVDGRAATHFVPDGREHRLVYGIDAHSS